MATIKSYTDLEQSKTLADILPLESADMEFMFLKKDNSMIGRVPFVKDGYEEPDCGYNIVPCWSLSALLGVVSEEVSLNSFKDGNWNAMVQQNGKMIYSDTNNPIDACCELILKLHELKLL